MSETKWTPGPWGWMGDTGILYPLSGKGRWILSAELCAGHEADAALIAAAPDLYEALMDAELTICALMKAGGAFDVPATIQKAKDALAKARGEPA